jgi:hypothetical protein
MDRTMEDVLGSGGAQQYEFSRSQERTLTIMMDSLRDASGATVLMSLANFMASCARLACEGVTKTGCGHSPCILQAMSGGYSHLTN